VITIGAVSIAGEDDRPALRAGLHRRPAVAVAALPIWLHHINRSVPLDISGEVKHKTVFFGRGDAHTSAGDLNVKTSRLSGA